MMESNGSQSEATEGQIARPYIVLEQSSLIEAVTALFKGADVGLGPDEWDRVRQAAAQSEGLIYAEIDRVPSRNAAHALKQVGRRYETGVTPPLVAVSERMFRARTVTVENDPRVTLS